MTKSPRPKRLSFKLILIAFGVLFGVAVAEVALRVAGYAFPLFYIPDSSRGYSLLPGAEGPFTLEGSQTYVRINSRGLHDHEHSVTKPENTVRIAMLGDSYAEAMHVGVDNAFWSVMATKLAQCRAFDGKNVEVINFGVSGYGTAQELITLKEQVWNYAPDIVILAVTTANDVADNSRELKRDVDVPYFLFDQNQLKLDDSFRNSKRYSAINRFGRWLRAHSRVVQAVIEGHRGFKVTLTSWRTKHQDVPAGQTGQGTASKEDLLARSQELGVDNVVYLEPTNTTWIDAWKVTERLIVDMRDEVARHSAKFLVVTLSNGPQVLPSPGARENFKQRFRVTDLFYPDHRFKVLGDREHFTTINLAPELQSFAERNHTFLHGFGTNIGNGHWNEAGHRAAGELLAKKICDGGLFK